MRLRKRLSGGEYQGRCYNHSKQKGRHVCTQLCGAACDVSNTTYPTRTGRIGMGKTSRKSIAPPDRLWAEVVEYRFSNRIGSEAEAVRRLIQAGLTAARRAVSAPRRR
jgi:hypothetical protein